MINLIIGSILVLPFICVPFNGILEQFRMPKAIYFDLMCMGIIVFALLNGLKFQYKNKYLAYLAGWVFFTIFWNWYSPLMFSYEGKIVFNLATIEHTLHFILGITATMILCSYIERLDFVRIAKALCISSVLMSILGIMQGVHLNPFPGFLHYTAGVHVSILMDNPNLVGNYLALTIPFFLYTNELKYYLCLPLVLLCLYFCNSDLSMSVAFIGFILYFLFTIQNKKLTRAILITVLLLLVWGYFHQDSLELYQRFNCRFQVWTQGWNEFVKNPLFGRGLGSWKTFDIIYNNNMFFEAHNDWWERIIELGIVGLFFIVLVIVNSLRNFNYNVNNKLGFAYLTSFILFILLMSGSFVMETAPVMLTGLLTFIGVEKLGEL